MESSHGIEVGLDLLYNMKKTKISKNVKIDKDKPDDKVLKIILDAIKNKLNTKTVNSDDNDVDMLNDLLDKSIENVILIATLINKKNL